MSRISLILISGVCALVGASFAKAQQTSQATTGWFQPAQAEQGHELFNNYCAECHGPNLSGALGPALKGSAFLNKWTGKPLSALYHFEHTTMPALDPNSLPDAEFTKLPELLRGNSVTLVTDTIAVRGYRIECEKIGLKPEERSDDSRRQRRDSRERDRR